MATLNVYATKAVTVGKVSADLVDKHTVTLHKTEKENQPVTAKLIYIETGAQPRTPKIAGMFDEVPKDRVWSYQEIWGVKKLKKKL